METSLDLNILDEIKLLDEKDNTNITDIVIEKENISIVIDEASKNNLNTNNQLPLNINNDKLSLNHTENGDHQRSFHLTSSCSVDSFEKIMKNNSGSHSYISNKNNNPQDPHIIDNNSLGKKSNLSKKINADGSSMRPSSMSSIEMKEYKSSIHNDASVSECNSCEQVPPLKTKRPSLNFIKHITGFSELANKAKSKNKGVLSPKDENKSETSSKKSNSIKKVIIRSDSNIIGHFENVVVVREKKK